MRQYSQPLQHGSQAPGEYRTTFIEVSTPIKSATMKTSKKVTRLVLAISISILFSYCSKDDPGPEGTDNTDGNNIEKTLNVDVDLPTDKGEVGFVIDTREIFRKGYFPDEAVVEFQEYPEFNTTLEINAITNFAILRIPNEDLTTEQKDAMNEGVAVEISIFDAGQELLATYQGNNQILNDSNTELKIETTLPHIIPELKLKAGVGYLLQPEGVQGVIGSIASDAYSYQNFIIDNSVQPFYFIPVSGEEDTFTIHHPGYAEGSDMYLGSEGWLTLGGGAVDLPADGPQKFKLKQEADGWINLQDANNPGNFLFLTSYNSLEFRDELPYQRFRLISDEISWHASDQGVQYSDPVMPPTELDFAYEATIRNCTSGILTETVGNSQSRTSTSTVETSESLQLFTSEEVSFSATVGMEVGGELYGATGSVEATLSGKLSTSATSTTENKLSDTNGETSEVSRSRELQIQPYSGVEVYDAIRIVNNVRIPFTQLIRISGTYKNSGISLTGAEIVSQLLFNLSSGIPSAIGADYVDVSIRGSAVIDQMFEVETGANQINDACN